MWRKNLHRIKKRISFLCSCLVLFLVTGCTPTSAPLSDAFAITFTDALGRTVSLPEKPQRTAALLGSFADIWVLSGGTIVAAPEDAKTDFSLETDDMVHLGGAHSPNVESLFRANPDFVLASASTASNVTLLPTLESASIPVAYFDVDTFNDYLDMLDICTDITGRKDLYAENGLRIKERIDRLKTNADIDGLPEEKRTVLLVRASSGAVKAKGSHGTILGEMLSELGCLNIADHDKTILDALSTESILRLNPYRIFAVTMGHDSEKSKENLSRFILENPAFSVLDAVKENRVHIMDGTLFNTKPNAKWADAYEELIRILYAE